MDAIEYLKEKKRATKDCNVDCDSCVLGMYDNTLEICFCVEDMDIEEAVRRIEKWSNENPQKTMLQDFMEKYPNAFLEDDGTPKFCPYILGYCNKKENDIICSCVNYNCVKCWNRPLKE